jgi:hypothetical protein
MAMTLRLSEQDDRMLTERARSENRSKQEVVREAVHNYLSDPVRRIEDLEDELALARYRLRKQLGEVTYVSQAEARAELGLPPAQPRRAGA